jgi:uncharacterized protein YkwD
LSDVLSGKRQIKLAAGAAGLALVFMFCANALAQNDDSAIPIQVEEGFASADAPGAAGQIFELLNGEREKAGLPPLAWDDGLAAAAQRHSQLMVRQNKLTHRCSGESDLRERLAGVPLDQSGENVAVDSGGAASAHEGLMHSPPHRKNILDPDFNAVGIGAVQNGRLLWVTQDFARRLVRTSDRSAADTVAGAFLRAREQKGLPPLERAEAPNLSGLACAMGRRDRLDTASALDLPAAYASTAYTASVPAILPSDAARLAGMRGVRRFAVGVCFARSASYPSGTYWVALVLFAR